MFARLEKVTPGKTNKQANKRTENATNTLIFSEK
jgi:hypothetical protein